MNIAVLLTCFNRKLQTMQCLESLFFILPNCNVYLVDDGSTDSTNEAVKKRFPSVTVIDGDGSLFWNRGMRLAWSYAASQKDYDFYIWLNDDVLLYKHCIDELLTCSNKANNTAIITGIIESKDGNQILYGGTNLKKQLIQPNGHLQHVIGLNGNVVLVPKYVYKILGNLDQRFHHDLGDLDYGLRAAKQNISVFTTRVGVASGTVNRISRLRKNNATFIKRVLALYSPLGSNPNINFYFRKNHHGILHALLFYVFQHFLIVIPDKVNSWLFKNKYR
jgi:GT2 family glycosyltransferase